jgi:hypothetical protein
MVLTRERLGTHCHIVHYKYLFHAVFQDRLTDYYAIIIIIIIITFIAVPITAVLLHRKFASSGTFRDSCGVHDSLYERHLICVHAVLQLLFSYKYNLIFIVVLPCILISSKLLCQKTHSLLKHKMLQLTLKIFLYMASTCFGPFGPSSGSIRRNFAKVTVFVELLVKIHR